MALLAGVPGFGSLHRAARFVHRKCPAFNFITLHYIYFIATCLVTSALFWGISSPSSSVRYIDSLFLVVSAMTLAGLNTVNLSTLNTAQQIILFFLIMLGSAIFLSAFVVHVRKRAFEQRFDYIAELRQRKGSQARKARRLSVSLVRRVSRSSARPDTRSMPVKQGVSDINQAGKADKVEQPAERPDGAPPITADGETDAPQSNCVGKAEGASNDVDKTIKSTKPDLTLYLQPPSFKTPPVQRDAQDTDYFSMPSPSAAPNPGSPDRSPRQEVEIDQLPTAPNSAKVPEHITFGPDTVFGKQRPDLSPSRSSFNRLFSMQGIGARSDTTLRRRSTNQSILADSASEEALRSATAHLPFLSSGFVSRNSQFHHLTDKDREELGGYEYRAVKLLSWLVPAYFVLFQFFSCLALGAYVANNKASIARANGLDPWWVGAFNAVSAFNNSGMSLLDANMVAFQSSAYMLLSMGLLILAGNTCYPIFLRLIVWAFLKISPNGEEWEDFRQTLHFLLAHPRRCYTNMFPAPHTWWLLSSVVCLNGIDWVAFELLNIGNKAITSLPAATQIVDGLFQALAVRSGGFYVVPIPSVRISLQVLYVIMMYISVYPVVITMRNSNVYEERSLGIYADDPGYAALPSAWHLGFLGKLRRTVTNASLEQTTKSYFVRQQLRAQLAHDLWWIVLAVFLVMIVEGDNFSRDPTVFSVFNVIFEIVSAYGCVGISVGVPGEAYSFSGAWHTVSKLILCAVMIRGRHRGLPVAIDKAVSLPGERQEEAEEEDGWIRMERSVSRGRVV
ncbi:TrkH-domain-containing protein [Lojkania enalia]|uniref:Potassium transport protein n=1 Tax=Lojkania enalia TaxID=147567 RepID=A0A9P4K501_9PLEO|nr:TrkH-domain-containing protein [Didymosphaeria enalia]